MEEVQNKQSKLQAFYQTAKDSVFSIMQELLKNKKSGKWFSCFLMLVMHLQLIAFLFDKDNDFSWKDEYLLDAFTQICDFVRLLPTIQSASSASFYWMLYSTGMVVTLSILLLFIYIHYSLSIKRFYFTWPVNLLRGFLILLYWVFYSPVFESLLSIFRCQNGKHFIDTSMTCYQGAHIFFMVLSILFSILMFLICFLNALMYQETQPVAEDALARLENNFEVVFLFFRTAVIIFSTFIYSGIANWIVISAYLASSTLFTFQYFKYVPYFNSFVSVFWGTLIVFYAWASLNALLMMLLGVYGHLIILFSGIPLIALLVKNLREKRIQHLLLMGLDKMKSDTDALIQIQTIQGMITEARNSQSETGALIGYVNLHVVECQNSECPCKNDSELFDAASGKFSQRTVGYHKDYIFLNHLNKRLYEDALNKFINSPRLHIAFSFFLFDTMRNVHAALIDLNIASKKKPSLQQQFTIFRNKDTIENFIKAETTQAKDIYNQLTNVIEFERLFIECQRAIERVCSFQIEFWTQLGNPMPDMNLLHDFASKLFDGSKDAEDHWSNLCKVNANYSKALTLYGNYVSQVKNNEQLGYELLDKAKINTNKKSMDELVKSSDILFADDTVVLHISGNKETAGRIVKTNQGLTKIFGYSKSEVLGHFVNIIMPGIFAKRHNEFLEKFFRTGRKTMFNQERYMYALNRSGCCFQIKIMIKQLPNLTEGIQYVAMIRQTQADYDYIITDMRGVIDCFSQGVGALLKLSANLFKDNEINIQILAPELIKVFSAADRKRTLLEKFKEAGGQKLVFMVPKDFAVHAQTENKRSATKETAKGMVTPAGSTSSGAVTKTKPEHRKRGKNKVGDILYRELNKDMNKHGGVANKPISPHRLMESLEYKGCENRQTVRCEIQDPVYGETYKEFEPLKLRVFKISGINNRIAGSPLDMSSDAGDNPLGGSHSGASFDWHDSREINMSSRGFINKEDTKVVMDYVLQSNSGEVAKPALHEEDKGGEREDTKGTEKIPGNVMTTESRLDTLEAKGPSALKLKFMPDRTTGEMKTVVDDPGKITEIKRRTDTKNSEEDPLIQKQQLSPPPNLRIAEDDKKRQGLSPVFAGEQKRDEEERSLDSKKSSEMVNVKVGPGSESVPPPFGTPPLDKKKDRVSPCGTLGKKSTSKEGRSRGLEDESADSKKSKSTPSLGMAADKESSTPRQGSNKISGLDSKSQKQDAEFNPFGYVEGAENDSLDRPEESESVGQLSKPSPVKVARLNIKVPSMLDEIVGSQGHNKVQSEEKKESSSDALGPKQQTNVFIDSRDQRSELSQDEDRKPGRDDELRSLPSVPPLKFKQNSRDNLDNESQLMSAFEKSSRISEKDGRRPLDMQKKPTKGEDKRMLHEKRSTKQIRKKFHSKIITNPKYEEGEDDMKDLQEYHPGDEEIKLRRALIDHEKKKKSKEKKKEEAAKKHKKMKKEEEKTKSDGEESDEKPESKEESKSEEGKNEEGKKPESEESDEQEQETQSSVTSGSTGSTIRSFYSLRAAIDEKFVPSSIKNLRCTANIVFLLLLSLAIVYFVMQVILFDNINKNIKNVRYSENRLNHLIDINLYVTKMMFITADAKLRAAAPGLPESQYVLYDNSTVKNQTFETCRAGLRTAATALKDAQTDLSQKTSSLSSSSLEKINPQDVALDYKQVRGMPTGYNYTIWQAIMEVVVSSFRIATMALNEVDDNTDSTVYFVTKNSLNGILINLKRSTQAIIDETDSSRKTYVFIFLLLMCGATLAMVVSTALLIPVIRRVKMNKQEVLELFMNIKKEAIDEQLKTCKRFYSTFQPNPETEINVGDEAVDGKEKENKEEHEEKEERAKRVWERSRGSGRRHKRFKSLAVGLGYVAIKFGFVLIIMEGYFIMTYFLSSTFLSRVSSLTTEMSQLISRLPAHGLFLLVVETEIFKNYGVQVMKQDADTFIKSYESQIYDDEDRLLDTFSDNYDYHTSTYNQAFNSIVFSNLCAYIDSLKATKAECEAFYQGILQKGVYSSVIKYWDFLRQLNHDFNESSRSATSQYSFLNDDGLETAETMESVYFSVALNTLINQLENDIDNFFTQELSQDKILFIVYIVYLVIVYVLIWVRFVAEMQHELWKTKSVLSILTPELIVENTQIKDYILSNSSTVFFSKGKK